MQDRDGKKPFIIPKTHASNKEVLIPQQIESRNVTELFNDIKSCSLQLHFDFRQNQCKSCDIIRNQKLQKAYNERRIQMKKEHEPTERFAFHLITSRTMALNIATDGLSCEQLTFPIEKYLGNPKDGIHLSRRPDVLLASSGVQGLYSFGLLVCKILLAKGYATIPSVNNKQLPAQLHSDYHFCKIQSVNKEQDHIYDILASSLIFCYEHEVFQTRSHPSQILPVAILWYDLTEKFPPELTPIIQQPKIKPLSRKKSTPMIITRAGNWEKPIEKSVDSPPVSSTPAKYPSQNLIPYSPLYTSFSNSQTTDSPIVQQVVASETIPLSPVKSIRDLSPSIKRTTNEKQHPPKSIPLNNSTNLLDPRLQAVKKPHQIFYLEPKAMKRARQQQKRLNQYCDSTIKTHYSLIPFHIQSTSLDEYVQQTSPELLISVVDCLKFGLKSSPNQSFIDLEQNDNQIAYEQIQRSNELIEQTRDLGSQEIRLHRREKQQRKIHEYNSQQKKSDLLNAKIYLQNGRKLLKEHQQNNPSKREFSFEFLDFFTYEYHQENRPHVKRILAELLGIWIEKYALNYTELRSKATESTNDLAMKMEFDSIIAEGLGDRDERFRVHTPPITESMTIQPPVPSLLTISHESTSTFNQSENLYNPMTVLTADQTFPLNDNPRESLSEEMNANIIVEQTKQISLPPPSLPTTNEDNCDDSREQFVKVLTKEAFTSQSPSSTLSVSPRQQSPSDDDDNDNDSSNTRIASKRTVIFVSNNDEDNLIIKTTNTNPTEEFEEDDDEQSEVTVKRIKVDSISPVTSTTTTTTSVSTNDFDNKSVIPSSSDDYDYRQDFDERRQMEDISRSRSQSSSSRESNSKSLPSHNRRYKQPFRRYEPNRTYQYQQRNQSNSTRHQRFNYNHQSVADHRRFAHSSTHHNYNSFSTNNHSQNQNVNSSYYNDGPFYQDNYYNHYQLPPPLMSATPLFNYPNTCDMKSSETFEHSQTSSKNVNSSSSENSNQHQWSSKTNTSDNESFTRHDAEQLLNFVQRYRH